MLGKNIVMEDDGVLILERRLQAEVVKRLAVEAELVRQSELLMLALNGGHLNIWEWDVKNDVINDFGYFEPLVEKNIGQSRPQLDYFFENMHPDDCKRVKSSVTHSLNSSQYYDEEFRFKMRDGRFEWIAARGQCFRDEHEQAERMCGIWSVITAQKKAKELARQQQNTLDRVTRLHSMGEMSSSLAHELAQPLFVIQTYVSGCIQRFQEHVKNKAAILDVLNQVMEQVNLAGGIIHRMKNFFRKEKIACEKIQVNHILHEAIDMSICKLLPVPIEFCFDLVSELPEIEIDRIQLIQVFINLINNSIEAMAEAENTKPKITISTGKIDAHTIQIRFQDQGPGISLENMENLFTPCFSTKSTGMGIGLAICRSIIESYGGRISANNLVEGGACFELNLPVTCYEK